MSLAMRALALFLDEAERPTEESDRQRVALAIDSPKRAEPGPAIVPQADAGHLPLFVASNEPRLL